MSLNRGRSNGASGHMRAFTVTTIVGLGLLGIVIDVAGSQLAVPDGVRLAARSVAGGVIASAIVYALVSYTLEPARQLAQAARLIAHANDLLSQSFHEHFSSLPVETYQEAQIPSSKFSKDYVNLLSSSSSFDFKGGSARFMTFRLAALCRQPGWRNLDRIRISVLDPRAANKALRAFAIQQMEQTNPEVLDGTWETGTARNARLVDQTIDAIRNDIYVTLVTLFDIRFELATEVYFHRDLPFFRAELFEGGMFLTYYQERTPYPTTYQYATRSGPYEAYRLHMRITCANPYHKISFGSGSDWSDDKLVEQLRELEHPGDLSALRLEKDVRFERLRSEVQRAGLNISQLF